MDTRSTKNKFFKVVNSRVIRNYFFFFALTITTRVAFSQQCDNMTQTAELIVDLTGSPSGVWLSPDTCRFGQKCGNSHPDLCIEFLVTLDPGKYLIILSEGHYKLKIEAEEHDLCEKDLDIVELKGFEMEEKNIILCPSKKFTLKIPLRYFP